MLLLKEGVNAGHLPTFSLWLLVVCAYLQYVNVAFKFVQISLVLVFGGC